MASTTADSDPKENFVFSEGVEFAPFRSLNEFVFDARFEMPPFDDAKKWNNRVVTNLLYFQTNYFILFAILFLLVLCYQSHKMNFNSLIFAFCLPLVVILVHASLRLRNLGAKVNLHLENAKVRNTVMATILAVLGLRNNV